MGVSGAKKILNHYGFADPPEHGWDDWTTMDTRDDAFYEVSQSNQDPHKNDQLTETKRKPFKRIVNDARSHLDELDEIWDPESGELPHPEDFPEAEVEVAGRMIRVPDGFKPKWADAYLDNPNDEGIASGFSSGFWRRSSAARWRSSEQ